MQKKEFLRIGPLTSVLMCLLLLGCGPSADEQAATPTALTATADTEWSIPTDFETYTDENKTFSISYPPDWKVDFSIIPDMRILSEELLESMDIQLDLGKASVVFFVGVPCGIDCFHPACVIVVEPAGDFRSIEEYDADAMLELKSISEEVHEVSRENTIIDGRASIINEYEVTFEGADFPLHNLDLGTINGDLGWTAACSLNPEIADFTEYEDDFHNVVRSLQLHE